MRAAHACGKSSAFTCVAISFACGRPYTWHPYGIVKVGSFGGRARLHSQELPSLKAALPRSIYWLD